jgi:hypothetical protein
MVYVHAFDFFSFSFHMNWRCWDQLYASSICMVRKGNDWTSLRSKPEQKSKALKLRVSRNIRSVLIRLSYMITSTSWHNIWLPFELLQKVYNNPKQITKMQLDQQLVIRNCTYFPSTWSQEYDKKLHVLEILNRFDPIVSAIALWNT